MNLASVAQSIRTRLGDRRWAYRALFLHDDGKTPNPAGEVVLRDLARICYANKTTAMPTDRAAAVAEGRRQVWLHIQQCMRLSDDPIHQLTQERDIE